MDESRRDERFRNTDDDIVHVTEGDVITGDIAGPDVSEGWVENQRLDGLGADLDSMPGDETPISRMAITEQDQDRMRLGTEAGGIGDTDMDDSQTSATSTHPLYSKGT